MKLKYKNPIVQMLRFRKILLLGLGLMVGNIFAQTQLADLRGIFPLEETEEFKLSEENKSIVNSVALEGFFEKLQALEKGENSKVQIIHIGDSHIQAGFFSGKNREILQDKFGNAGLGFIFPHRLANSNGISEVRYASSVPWQSKRNIYAGIEDSVGISGFKLFTELKDFAVNIKVEEEKYFFNTLKLISPQRMMFSPAKNLKDIRLEDYSIQKKTHIIKSGEALSIIARKYGVTVNQIKQANRLQSNMIRAGDRLVIPVKAKTPAPIERSAFDIMEFDDFPEYSVLHAAQPMQSIWLLSNDYPGSFSINGLLLERDDPGILYSGIGVNGARFSDYNKTPLFFEQLKTLNPDLLVISLGTNEAHDHLKPEKFKEDLRKFVQNLKENEIDAPVLFTSPPPSLLKRQFPNTYSESYAHLLNEIAEEEQVAVWDLFEVLGGKNQVRNNFSKGIISRDYVHYSKKGYVYSAELFTEAVLNAYYFYIYHKQF